MMFSHAIAVRLNAEGHRTSIGKPGAPATLHAILTRR
jgi:hypothetical protein